MPKTLAIVGAGPKAAAIVARAAVLRDLRPEAELPVLKLYERAEPGAAWSGTAGFTSGLLTLCSPAEKDIGFPYVETEPRDGAPAIAPELHRRFSWSAYLVEAGRFAEWVDRGREPPTHSDWARYIRWVFDRAGTPWVRSDVKRIVQTAQRMWRVTHEDPAGVSATDEVDGVVLTGTGRARRVREIGEIPPGLVFDAEDVWANRACFLDRPELSIAVVGDGGAAGAIAAWLAPRLAERRSSILSISPMGTLLPRGDGYGERRWFTDPSDWPSLSLTHRRTLLAHTEAGVVSARNKAVIDAAANIDYVAGRAKEVSADGGDLTIRVAYEDRDADRERTFPVRADMLINATGFDRWSVLDIVGGKAQNLLLDTEGGRRLRDETEAKVLPDLSLPDVTELAAGLHVPGLAGLAQGPGFPTLGCLGLTARLVLDRYTS